MTDVKSMTGFASVRAEFKESEFSCEIRSVNSRYLEIFVKLPKIFADFESPVKELIRKQITRGKIMFTLNYSAANGEVQSLRIKEETVKSYLNLLDQMKTAAGIESPVKLDHLLFFKDVFSFEEDQSVSDEFRGIIEQITRDATSELNRMRAREGKNLTDDINSRLNRVIQLSKEVAEIGKGNARVEFDKLYRRLLNLLEEEKIDKSRLEQELALISDRVDITEETVRMRSHIELFRDNLNAGSPIGKKLNFILQEMHRESNTMSSKATMIEISHRVVEIKEDIEKIREQVQNIE